MIHSLKFLNTNVLIFNMNFEEHNIYLEKICVLNDS